MKLLLWLALVAVVCSESEKYVEDGLAKWDLFKIEYEKIYESKDEEKYRQGIFLENYEFVKHHNRKYSEKEVTFDVEINKFADMTTTEFSQMINGLRIPKGYNRTGTKSVPEDVTLPSSVDWRKTGAVTPVKDQGKCGSCWAFSATGGLEGQTFLKTKTLVSLSEQNLVDCSSGYGNRGCNGGLMNQAFDYIKGNNGIDTEETYPYKGQQFPCNYDPQNNGSTCTGYVDIQSGSEEDLQQAVANIGPVCVGIDASHPSFHLYKSGVYKEARCSSQKLDHGVLVVGYDTAALGGDYWLVKNSWGTSWGMKGYIMMSRNHSNMCGIATLASYPKV